MAIIFLLLILSSFTSLVLSADQNDDYSVLLKIKEQLGNPPDALPEWVYGFGFCNNVTDVHSFVACTSTGRVKSLSLFDLHLSAPFRQAICDLIELEYLSIFLIYDLCGPFPSCINKLINLRSFYVGDTNLSGPVPEFLNQNNLTQITLSNNNLSGSIPSSLSKLQNLEYLNLYNNSLTGAIPSGLVPAPSAEINLSHNRLTGKIPRCYGWVNFENLTGLVLNNNGIYGKVPNSIANASVLSWLNLSSNRLCGEIPQGGGTILMYMTTIHQNNDTYSSPSFCSDSFSLLMVDSILLNLPDATKNCSEISYDKLLGADSLQF
ncbi:uncharacterized protein LOC144569211 [Carex rostrata]